MIRNEFRLGNLVLRADGWSGDKAVMFSEHPYEIDSLDFKYAGIHDFPDFKGCMDVEYKDLKGIELTEEWLIKFGFEYDKETKTWSVLKSFDKFDYIFEIEYLDKEVFKIIDNVEWCYKYIHQLQNLYFALTGEELTIK